MVVAVVGHRYGWEPPGQPAGEKRSVTWLECAHAVEIGKEVLAFLVDDETPWPETQRDEYEMTRALRERRATSDLTARVQEKVARLRGGAAARRHPARAGPAEGGRLRLRRARRSGHEADAGRRGPLRRTARGGRARPRAAPVRDHRRAIPEAAGARARDLRRGAVGRGSRRGADRGRRGAGPGRRSATRAREPAPLDDDPCGRVPDGRAEARPQAPGASMPGSPVLPSASSTTPSSAASS